MQYFKDRTQAGALLAEKMTELAKENNVVLALSEGAVVVGAEIAKQLHSALFLLATEDIRIPEDPSPIATMSTQGLTYGSHLSPGQLESFKTDYHSIIDQASLEAFRKINRIIGKDGEVKRALLKRHAVILVSDGLGTGMSLDVAADYLKPIAVRKIVVATPLASIAATDRMHVLADQIFCLSILENYFGTDHYYDDNTIPDHKTVVEIMKNIVYSW